MKISQEYESPLRLKRFAITKGKFERSVDCPEDITLKVSPKYQMDDMGDGDYLVELTLRIADEEKHFFVEATAQATFFMEGSKGDRFAQNMLAIMFPYLRSYVSLLTTQPEFPPIVLPTMNIVAMVGKQSMNQKQS